MINTPIDHNNPIPTHMGNWKEEVDRMKTPSLQHINRLGTPINLIPGQATLEDIYINMILRQRLKPTTAKKRIRTLEYIANHPIAIDLANPTLQDWINHSDYREQIEGATTALQNEWKAMKTLLTSYGMQHWNYKPPTTTTETYRVIPHPHRVRNMIRHPYTGKKDHDRHIKYLITATHMIGGRNPSEYHNLTLDDVNLEHGTILIKEPKKGNKKRLTRPYPQFMTGRNCPSMKYWIEKIRPKYTTHKSKEYLFITLTGNPFTPDYLRKYLTDTIKPAFPEYQPYTSRHWYATARLIQEYIDTKHWNKARVQRNLGHETQATTDTYISQAETWMEIAPYNWFTYVLNPHTLKNQCEGVKHVCEHDYKEKESTDLWGTEQPQQKEIVISENGLSASVCLQPSSFFITFHHDRKGFDFLGAGSCLSDLPSYHQSYLSEDYIFLSSPTSLPSSENDNEKTATIPPSFCPFDYIFFSGCFFPYTGYQINQSDFLGALPWGTIDGLHTLPSHSGGITT